MRGGLTLRQRIFSERARRRGPMVDGEVGFEAQNAFV